MTTTVDLPDGMLDEALRWTGLTTKKAVITLAMEEMLQGYRQREALARIRQMDHSPFLTEEELAAEGHPIE